MTDRYGQSGIRIGPANGPALSRVAQRPWTLHRADRRVRAAQPEAAAADRDWNIEHDRVGLFAAAAGRIEGVNQLAGEYPHPVELAMPGQHRPEARLTARVE